MLLGFIFLTSYHMRTAGIRKSSLSTSVPQGLPGYRDEQNWAWAALPLCRLVIPLLSESK